MQNATTYRVAYTDGKHTYKMQVQGISVDNAKRIVELLIPWGYWVLGIA